MGGNFRAGPILFFIFFGRAACPRPILTVRKVRRGVFSVLPVAIAEIMPSATDLSPSKLENLR